MRENKNDQDVEKTNADHQQIYGSLQQGRHNREGIDPLIDENSNLEDKIPFIEQQNSLNHQNQGNQDKEENSDDYEMDDDQYEQGQFSSRSHLNEMQDDNMVAKVEGDDKDILGETENSQRNQQRMRKRQANQGSSQNR